MACFLARLLGLAVQARQLPLAPGERVRQAPACPRGGAGRTAEDAACKYLQGRGYRLLCRNRVNAAGELDIVAQEGDMLVFVEVRGRAAGSPVLARDSLTRHKQRRLARAAELFRRQHGLTQCPFRIDFVAVELDGDGEVLSLEHFEQAVGQEAFGR